MLPSDSHADVSLEARRHFELASSLDEQENFGAALVECDQALRLAPRWAEAHNFRGLLLEELGRTDDAISAYRKAMLLDPTFVEARQNLAEAKKPRALSQPSPSQALTAAGVVGQSFGKRTAAYLIDFVVLFVANYVIGIITGTLFGSVVAAVQLNTGQRWHFDQGFLAQGNCIAGIPFAIAYFFLFEYFFGASPGKTLLGMRVVMTDGSPCTARAAWIRGLWRYIDGLLFGLVAYSSMKKTALRQRIGDVKSHTLVVSREEGIIRDARPWSRFFFAFFAYAISAVLLTVLWLLLAIRAGT